MKARSSERVTGLGGRSHVDGPLSRDMAIKRATRSLRCELGSQDCISAFRPEAATPLLNRFVTTVHGEPDPFFLPTSYSRPSSFWVSECGTPEPWKDGPSSEGFDRNLSSSEGLDPTPPISPPGGGHPQPTVPRFYLDYVCREYC